MTKPAAHNHPWKISDVVMFPALAIAILVELLAPTRLPWAPFWLFAIIGAIMIIAGFWLISASKTALDQQNQPSLPGQPTTRLVTSGVFRFSRNPNYLGAIMIAFGLGFAVNSLWFIAVAAGAMLVLDRWMIQPEERYLQEKFGAVYDTYKYQTRRWF